MRTGRQSASWKHTHTKQSGDDTESTYYVYNSVVSTTETGIVVDTKRSERNTSSNCNVTEKYHLEGNRSLKNEITPRLKGAESGY